MLAGVCVPASSFAHSVYIYGWIEGDQVCTESYYTRNNKVRGGTVRMADAAGEVLAEGVTDEAGRRCFSLPRTAQDIRLTVLASPGHGAEYLLERDEISAAMRDQAVSPAAASSRSPSEEAAPQAEPAANRAQPGGSPAADRDFETTVRSIVREELQAQLGPVRQVLAEGRSVSAPGVREVVGGLGWLAGLGALGYWASHKRKKS